MDIEALKKRIDALVGVAKEADNEESIVKHSEVYNGTITILSAVYGSESHQVSGLLSMHKTIIGLKGGRFANNLRALTSSAVGALNNLKAEIEGGLTGSLQKRLTSEVLTDLIQLARAVLAENGEGAKNVAAVLTAAAFEDTIRRMGATFAGLMGKNDLSDVIDALRQKGTLVSPQLGTAQSFLSFRNHALHANWEKIDRSEVASALAFVQELILKHFQ